MRTEPVCLSVALFAAACTGSIGAGTGGGGPDDSAPNASEPAPGAPGNAGPFTNSSGLRRLTRTEYTNTIRSLFGVEVDRSTLPKETLIDGHSQIAGAQKTGYEDVEQFYTWGDQIGAQVAQRFVAESQCSEQACLTVWASELLDRAFRTSVPDALRERHISALVAPESGETTEDRVRTFVSAVLSSPYFLYRREIGAAEQGETSRLLHGDEIAARLSYLVWQDTPDDELLALAAQGSLGDAVVRGAQLERMLADARAPQGLRGFVSDWMGVFDNALGRKNAALLAQVTPEFPEVAERTLGLMIDATLAPVDARFSDLLSTDQFVADATLAAVLGLDVALDGFQKVTVPVDQRRGILTHPMVIGAHSKESGPSPFPIGMFVYENVLCEDIPPPIPGIPTLDSEGSAGQTLRQTLESLTQDAPCSNCHVRIGPPGFAFLTFDPIGRYHAADGQGRAYDTAGKLTLPDSSETVPFANASELSAVLAEDPATARCVARRLFRWSFGRFESSADAATLQSFESVAVNTRAGVRDLLRAIVESPEFVRVRVKQ